MGQNNTQTALNYYKSLNNRDINTLATYLHPQVHLISPFSEITGIDAVSAAAKDFTSLFNSLIVKEHFEQAGRVMIVYDLDCPLPVGSVRTAVLMTFKDDLIARIELFFNPEPFKQVP